MSTQSTSTARVHVWDLPTRLFHWALVVAVVGLVVTGQVGGNLMALHFQLGLLTGALLLFRLVWGVVGGRWSRFASFVRSPATIWRYLRGEPVDAGVGHNPLGALSVLALLGLLVVQVLSGLVADDEIANTGPLNRFVSGDLASLATEYHSEVGKTILIVLVILHVGAIAWYLHRKRVNLVRPMVLGDKALPPGTPASRDGWANRLVAALVFAACLGLMAWVQQLGQAVAF